MHCLLSRVYEKNEIIAKKQTNEKFEFGENFEQNRERSFWFDQRFVYLMPLQCGFMFCAETAIIAMDLFLGLLGMIRS